MKIRQGFISNSSSSSFLFLLDKNISTKNLTIYVHGPYSNINELNYCIVDNEEATQRLYNILDNENFIKRLKFNFPDITEVIPELKTLDDSIKYFIKSLCERNNLINAWIDMQGLEGYSIDIFDKDSNKLEFKRIEENEFYN